MASANETRQTEEELQVFESFPQVAALRVTRASIEKRPSPEPDIVCEFVGEGRRCFELGEVVDQRLRRAFFDGPQLQGEMFEAGKELDSERMNRCRNMSIFLEFKKHVALRERRLAIPSVWSLLCALPTEFAGTVGLSRQLQRVVRRLDVQRTDLLAPVIHVSSRTSFGDPILRTASEKLIGKSYESRWPLELLLWYGAQPVDDDYVGQWPADLDERVRSMLSQSVFRSVWIFDLHGHRVLRHVERASPCVDETAGIP